MNGAGSMRPVPASDVVDQLGRERGWKPRTVKTMLDRLVRKGALAYAVDGKRFLYSAKVARDACVKKESRSFLSRVFDGAVTPAVVHLLANAKLSDDELKQLRKVLDGEAK